MHTVNSLRSPQAQNQSLFVCKMFTHFKIGTCFIIIILLLTIKIGLYVFLLTPTSDSSIYVSAVFLLENNLTRSRFSSNTTSAYKFSVNSRQTTRQHNNKKRILIWTKFYGLRDQHSYCIGKEGLERQKQMCNYSCDFTINRSLINSSDAVVFHGRDLATKTRDKIRFFPKRMPKTRNLSQIWVFLMLESPSHTWTNISVFENVFNWSMSYRTDSDIFIPYGKVIERKPPKKNQYLHQRLQSNTRLVAWINTNCIDQPSLRNNLVTKLKEYINIDVYGSCGPFNCSTSNSNYCKNLLSCYTQISKYYKFYLALENSLCEDYVTEKAFNALRAGMVPIVYGHADYSTFLPHNSYINTLDFDDMKELAQYIYFLDQHPREYMRYFEWTTHYKVVEDRMYLERAWCSLCKRLVHQSDAKAVSQIVNLHSWWNFRKNSNVCVSPPAYVQSNFSSLI